jgi:hypothetical protein
MNIDLAIPEPIEADREAAEAKFDELSTWTTAALHARVAKLYEFTVECVREVAMIARILLDRGEDISGLSGPFSRYTGRLASGQLSPEAVFRFGHRPALMNRIGTLPVAVQKRLGEGERVPLVFLKDDGEPDTVLVDPEELRPAQIRQVFANERICPESEQSAIVKTRRAMRGSMAVEIRGTLPPDEAARLEKRARAARMSAWDLMVKTAREAGLI